MQLEISEKYLCVEKEQGRKEDVGMILLSEKNCIPGEKWEAKWESNEEALKPPDFGAPLSLQLGHVHRWRGGISSRRR